MIKNISPKAKKMEAAKKLILDFCKKQIKECGYSPSLDEIVIETGIPKTTVRRYLRMLEEDGRITRGRNKRGNVLPRALTPVDLLLSQKKYNKAAEDENHLNI